MRPQPLIAASDVLVRRFLGNALAGFQRRLLRTVDAAVHRPTNFIARS
jgi:hypothetical protein